MLRPASLSARLFAATVLVAMAAVATGAWLYLSATRVEIASDIRIVGQPGSAQEVQRREVVSGGMPLPAPPIDRRMLWLFAAIVVGGGAVTFAVTRQALAPLRDLRTAATRLADGDLRVRVSERGAAEFVTLARAFNGMAGRLEDQERLKRGLTNDVAHELRTPLTNLRCHLEALADGLVHADASGIAALQADVRQLERLVDDLGLLAQADTQSLPLHPEAVDVAALAREVAREVEPRAAAAGLVVTASTGAGAATAWVDPGRIRQVMANLVENGIAHTPAGGRLEIRVAGTDRDVEVAVADTGEGIGAEHLPHVFDRFYRADPSRSRRTGGVGLGLAIARQLVIASGGRIDVESRPGTGTTFRLRLPVPSQTPHNSSVSSSEVPSR